MGSIVEVVHHFPPHTMVDHNQSTFPRSEPSRSIDVSMTDATSTPASRQPSQLTRDLAFHNAHSSRPSTQDSPATASAVPPAVAHLANMSSSASSSQVSPLPSIDNQSPIPSPPSPPRIRVMSLSHIQSFVIDDQNPLSSSRVSSRVSLATRREITPQYEISDMPVAEIIEMVAGLLTKITSTNDRQHEYLHRQMPHDSQQSMNQQTSSVLAFHGKNVPTISILSYLSRIHKYCPTTYEVFLSLLVYFDRMTERVNAGPMLSLRQANQLSLDRQAAAAAADAGQPTQSQEAPAKEQSKPVIPSNTTPPNSGSLAPEDISASTTSNEAPPSPPNPIYPPLHDAANLSHFFVVDSFNIHRLVIAGVTCASKFFSDVFYTNSRYAKVSHCSNSLNLPLLTNYRLADFLSMN
jgi:hypothetical protein